MRKSVPTVILALILALMSLLRPSMADTVDIDEDQSEDGVTIRDRKDALISVRFVSPFKKRQSTSDDNVNITMKSTLTPMMITTLIGGLDKDATESSDPAESGNVGLTGALSSAYREAMDEQDLCEGPRIEDTSDLNGRLRDCANYYPAEYTVAVNYFQTYMSWRVGELSAIIDLYVSKATSSGLKDRLEGRLMTRCLEREIGNREELLDTTSGTSGSTEGTRELIGAVTRCTLPKYWHLNELFDSVDFEDCEAEGTDSGPDSYDDLLVITETNLEDNDLRKYVFDFPAFVRYCVLTEKRSFRNREDNTMPSGISAAVEMIPYVHLELTKPDEDNSYADADPDREATLSLKTYPMSVSVADLNDALFQRVYKFISSQAFADNATDGWIPSPFAPDDLDPEQDADWKDYCSIRLPPKFLQQMAQVTKTASGATALSNASQNRILFVWKVIAQRVAVLQSLELILGSAQISQEALRIISATDKELYDLVSPSVEYTKLAADSYKNSIDLAYATTLEDVVASMSEMTATLNTLKEKAAAQNNSLKQYIRTLPEAL